MSGTIRLGSAKGLAGAVTIAASGLVMALATSGDALVSAGFDRALAGLDLPSAAGHPPISQPRPLGPQPQAGSEQFWLEGERNVANIVPASAAGSSVAAPAVAAPGLGARMALTGPDGRTRTYEAIEIRPLAGELRLDAQARPAQSLVLVTWRDVDNPTTAELVRIIVDSAALLALPANPPRAL